MSGASGASFDNPPRVTIESGLKFVLGKRDDPQVFTIPNVSHADFGLRHLRRGDHRRQQQDGDAEHRDEVNGSSLDH